MKQAIIIGAGAAGCFAAIELARLCPQVQIAVLERGAKPLAKVAVTGGGRCNITNTFAHVKSLEQVYPRGHRLMKKLFHQFSPTDTQQWFEAQGVQLVAQADDCIFPRSQQAAQVVHTLMAGMAECGVHLHTQAQVKSLSPAPDGGWQVHSCLGSMQAQAVLVATGGMPRAEGSAWLADVGLDIQSPVPSLFALGVGNEELHALSGVVMDEAEVVMPGTPFRAQGPLLITHWGLSGPAILRLSSYAARHLAEQGYRLPLLVRWAGQMGQEHVCALLAHTAQIEAHKLVGSVRPLGLQSRLWHYLLQRAGVSPQARWADVQGRVLHRLATVLTADAYTTTGKCRYKDEFVTCGGVDLAELQPATLMCRRHPGLFVAGEVANVDALTGGFNLQAAWTMGHVAAQGMAQYLNND